MDDKTPEYDVFISYSWVEPDRTWVREHLAPALLRAGLKVCIDVESFVPGHDSIVEMTRGIFTSRHAICVLTPEYCKGKLSLFESLLLRRSDPTGDEARLIPLLFRQTQIPPWIFNLIPVDWLRTEDHPREWRRLLLTLSAPNVDVPCPTGTDTVAATLELPAGTGSREQVFGRGSLPGQVFAVELLTQPVVLDRNEHGRVCVTINRDKVAQALYSTSAKSELCRQVFADTSRIEAGHALDSKIHEFLSGRSEETNLLIRLRDLPLRWASGGALSIVRWRGRLWTPFFFRDIAPLGWNISLGASEKEDDLNDPWTFLLREFLEETLILDAQPKAGKWAGAKKFVFERLATGPEILQAHAFSAEHVQERFERDGLLIRSASAGQANDCVCVDFLNTRTDLMILHKGVAHPYRNVLACINILELGIEIVKVLEYRLGDGDVILDGEILEEASRRELLRLPVALISHDYLAGAFAGDLRSSYVGETQPSVEGPPIPENNIHIFPFDVERRRDIARGGEPHASEWEKQYYSEWIDRFGPYFLDESGHVTNARASNLFTPTSAKIMAYLFANSRQQPQ